MRSQRYGVSGHYVHHYDWTGASRRGDRVSTFMVYLEADCTGGGTNFPRMKMPVDKKWCEFIECGSGRDGEGLEYEGVTFKPIKGNAIFWENLKADGSGYTETWHAGLPVLSGTKVGLNIWSWYQPGGNS
jgi:prolyl 4-hydroxylase